MSRFALGLDASTPSCGVVVGRIDDDGRGELLACDVEDDLANQASARLAPRIEATLRAAGIEIEDVAVVACGRGPGTFTGTRVAVATAKGLAFGLGVPILPVSTLVAVAFSADVEGAALALLDARRGEVYAELVRCALEPRPRATAMAPERVAPLVEVVRSIVEAWPRDLVVTPVGPGLVDLEALPPGWRERARPLPGPTPVGLFRAIVAADAEGAAVAPEQVDAVYLRASYAELGVHAPRRPFAKSPFV